MIIIKIKNLGKHSYHDVWCQDVVAWRVIAKWTSQVAGFMKASEKQTLRDEILENDKWRRLTFETKSKKQRLMWEQETICQHKEME